MKIGMYRGNHIKSYSLTKEMSVFFAFIMLLQLMLTGCSKSVINTTKYNKKKIPVSLSSQVVASNNDYEMSWNDENKCIILKSLHTGEIWSNIPYEYILNGGSSENLKSTINITVSSTKTMKWTLAKGYADANEKGRIFIKKIDKGIRIIYCFDKYEISIPVDYVLRDDSISASIQPSNIAESGKSYVLVSVSLSPFLCSAKNADKNSYLFLPTGSGALMYAQEKLGNERKWSGEVYGNDATRAQARMLYNEEPIRLPVFGVKNGCSSILGIIEQNAGSAVIESEAGNPRTGYSTVYPTFYMRGYDIFEKARSDLYRVSGKMSQNTVTVGYYPLPKESGYCQMANRYRKYLSDNGMLKKSKVRSSIYSLTFLGGIMTTSSVMGIPKRKLQVMTSYLQAQSIVESSIKITGKSPMIRMMGYGESGVNTGKIAGGFSLPNIYGDKQQNNKFISYCSSNGISPFHDFDIIRYSKSGNGYSYSYDAAKTAILKCAEQSLLFGPFREYNKSYSFHFIKRSQFNNIKNDLIKEAKKEKLSSISLSSLSNTAYSDYSQKSYYVKGKIESDVSDMISDFKKSGYNISASSANSYAAGISDVVFDTPIDNGNYDVFDESIPFYEMVYKNTQSLYTPPINLFSNTSQAIMLAATSGTGLGFTLIANYDVSYEETQSEKLYGMVFDDNIELIGKSVKEYSNLFNSVSGASIKDYKLVEPGLSKTLFDNGVTVYANHTNQEKVYLNSKLKPFGYIVQIEK